MVMEESTLECYEPDDDDDVGDTQTAAVATSNNSDAKCTMVRVDKLYCVMLLRVVLLKFSLVVVLLTKRIVSLPGV